MHLKSFFLMIALLCTQWSMAQTASNPTMNEINYLALGDSYTIGEAVPSDQNWPQQLVRRLRADGIAIADPQIIAVTGWTTDELQAGIAKEDPQGPYGMVSLLIGVNNQYRGYKIAQYKEEFAALLQQAITFAGGDKSRVFVVAIPDYGVTPFGQKKEPERIDNELRIYNALAAQHCESLGIPFVDIYNVSKEALNNPAMNATDNLHPSTKMYSRWTDVIYPEVKELLEGKE